MKNLHEEINELFEAKCKKCITVKYYCKNRDLCYFSYRDGAKDCVKQLVKELEIVKKAKL